MSPSTFLKSYFAKDVYLEIHFCVIQQGIQNLFGSSTPRISTEVLVCESLRENSLTRLAFSNFSFVFIEKYLEILVK